MNLWYVFESLKDKNYGVKFSYFMAMNKKKIKDDVKALNDVQKISDEFKFYDKKRADLAAEMADRKEGTDKPIIENNQYIITKNKKVFDTAIESLKTEHSEVIKDRENQIKILNDILNETINFNGYKIKLDDVPESIDPTIIELFVNTNLIRE